MKVIKIYKLNLTEEEQLVAAANYYGDDINDKEVYEHYKNMKYDAADGGGMCYGDEMAMLYRLKDDWYLMLNYDKEQTFMEEWDIKDCYEHLGMPYDKEHATLIFYQDCL